jgi:hypothetical protein
MGAFDQFKQQADKVADGAKEQLGKRGKSAGADNPEQMQRGTKKEGRERGSERPDQTRDRMDRTDRMDRDSEADRDDWA